MVISFALEYTTQGLPEHGQIIVVDLFP